MAHFPPFDTAELHDERNHVRSQGKLTAPGAWAGTGSRSRPPPPAGSWRSGRLVQPAARACDDDDFSFDGIAHTLDSCLPRWLLSDHSFARCFRDSEPLAP